MRSLSMHRRIDLRWVATFALVACAPLWAQTPELARVQATHQSMREARNEEDRLALHRQLQALWVEALKAGHVWDVDWSLWNEAVVDVGTGGERLVVFTWNVELESQEQVYGGWVAAAAPSSPLGYDFALLVHAEDGPGVDEHRMFRHDQWHGALYYDGIVTYDQETPVYTLLAWDGADRSITRKWVETVEWRRGRARFGTPVFEVPTGLSKRVLLTYRNAVQATLRIEGDAQRIVMDHLEPESPDLRGQFAFYGPTLSYDALLWKRGRWEFQPDVDVVNPASGSPKEYRDPARRGRRRAQ